MDTHAFEGAVTVLFTDVEGSTDLRTRLGDEAADEMLRAHEASVRALVAEHGGREVKALGDGFMVAFASPRKAISCALAIQRPLQSGTGVELRVRIGINTGEVTEVGGDLFGAAVNAAARIAGKARGGQILLAGVVKDLAGTRPDLTYVDRGLYWLKGFPERWRLFEVLRRAAGPIEELTAPASGKTEFVGRDAERADLRRLVEQAAAGQGTVAMIGGEPGVGKTRLCEEVVEEASARGIMAWVGHCAETEAAPPYAPVVEMLESATRGISRETMREAFGESAPEIARILPELRRLFPDLPPPLELPPEQERRYLFNCIADVLERASRMQPLLLVLEDLHWADEPSLLLVQHLAERIADMPILVLGTYRDVELDVDRPLARTLEELLRRRRARRIHLGRLPKEAVGAMLRAMAGREAPPTLVDAVHSETEGNCFFVEEVFQHLAEEGKLFDARGEWRAEVEIGAIDVPEGVRLVLGRRLGRLSETARRALAGAAVIGRTFTFDLVEAVGEVSADALLDAVEEAQRARLLVASEDPLRPRFEFAHELIRQTLLTGLSLPRRQRLHLRIADAIERVFAADVEPHAADLAHHLYQAGAAADPARTTRFLRLTGDRAMQAAAFEEALRAFERAMPLLSASDRRARAELLVALGFAQRALGRTNESLASWREALDVYAELGDREAAAIACWDIGQQLAWSGRPAEGMEFVQRGLVAIGEARVPVRASLMSAAGAFLAFLDDHAEGMRLVDEALAIATERADRRLEGEARLARAIVSYSYLDAERIAVEGAEAAALLRETGAVWDLAGLLSLMGFAMHLTGRRRDAEAVWTEVETLANRIGHKVAALLAARGRAVRAFGETGDLEALERFAAWDLEYCRAADLEWLANSHTFRAVAAFWQGRWEEAADAARLAVETEPPGAFNGWAWSTWFTISTHLERREDALRAFDEVRARIPVPGRPATWGSWAILHGAAEGLFLLGERERAAALYPLVLGSLGTGAIAARSFETRLTETVAGIAAHAAGRTDDAERHFSEAARIAAALPHLVEGADVRRFHARMLAERGAPGDGERARELATDALEVYRTVGMPRHVEMAELLLKEL